MSPTIKVGIIQLQIQPGDAESNFIRASAHIRTVASRGAQLAVLPEYHLTGWIPSDPRLPDLISRWQEYLDRYQALARQCKINIVPGTLMQSELDPAGNHVIFNVAYFIDHEGRILGSYKKKNLWHAERSHLTSSTHSPHEVINTPLGPVGLLICWDLAFPEAFRELIINGAKIIIVPTYWTLRDCGPQGLARNPLAEAVFLKSTLTSRAFENTSAIVFVNAAGPTSDGFVGLSQVTMPFLGPIALIDHHEEDIRVVEMDLAILEEAEDNYRVRADIASKDWHYRYRRTDRAGGREEQGESNFSETTLR